MISYLHVYRNIKVSELDPAWRSRSFYSVSRRLRGERPMWSTWTHVENTSVWPQRLKEQGLPRTWREPRFFPPVSASDGCQGGSMSSLWPLFLALRQWGSNSIQRILWEATARRLLVLLRQTEPKPLTMNGLFQHLGVSVVVGFDLVF